MANVNASESGRTERIESMPATMSFPDGVEAVAWNVGDGFVIEYAPGLAPEVLTRIVANFDPARFRKGEARARESV